MFIMEGHLDSVVELRVFCLESFFFGGWNAGE